MRSRSEWKARPPRKQIRFDPRKIKGTCIHYAGYNVKTDPATTLHNIQAHHQNTKGWFDIAYNVAVGLDGSVWELRGLDIENGAQGGRWLNRSYVAVVALLGPGQHPSDGMVDGINEAIRLVTLKYPEATAVVPHRDLKPTSCPGDELTDLLRSGFIGLIPSAKEEIAHIPEALPGWPGELRRGSEGIAVARLQRAIGVDADGKFGPKTEAKLVSLQTLFHPHFGIEASGVAGIEMWKWVLFSETL